MKLEKNFKLKGINNRYPIIQGGMGIGISLYELASAVGKKNCIGTISSASLDQFVAKRFGLERMDYVEATAQEIRDTKKDGGVAAINIMVALESHFEKAVEGAVRGGVDMIISGAGLPMHLPTLVEKYAGKKDHSISLVPIVSSARALEIICKKWDKQGYRPDAVVLEGPKAGGHLGWSYKQVLEAGERFFEEYDLFEKLLPPVLDMANKYQNDSGPIPIITAGGIFTHDDIVDALYQGASAVQMGTRFGATKESGGTPVFKQKIVDSTMEDIVLSTAGWGSPCGLPFRYLKTSPLSQKDSKNHFFCICTAVFGGAGIDNTSKLGTKMHPTRCPERYVLRGGKPCPAAGTADYTPLVTCGTNGYRVDKILSVDELVNELVG